MPASDRRRPIDHARALVQAGHDGVPPPPEVLAWVAGGMALHLHQGVGLPQALGLARHGGAGGAALIERRAQRDALLREVYRRHYFEFTPRAAASEILEALERQLRARGRVTDDLSRTLEALLRFDPPMPSSIRQVARTLDIQDPL